MLKSYLAEGNDVVLISDMYLPKETIQKMLAKADPLLATLPLFLSSDKGYQKNNQKIIFWKYIVLSTTIIRNGFTLAIINLPMTPSHPSWHPHTAGVGSGT